ncbi:hypothetical protein T492DRAFT_1126247 [Pavlovales sp. CCMP2436]|nr:hypothetical protein T492DRAFT_1126247 [Pavlovales sp. CCMP2436]
MQAEAEDEAEAHPFAKLDEHCLCCILAALPSAAALARCAAVAHGWRELCMMEAERRCRVRIHACDLREETYSYMGRAPRSMELPVPDVVGTAAQCTDGGWLRLLGRREQAPAVSDAVDTVPEGFDSTVVWASVRRRLPPSASAKSASAAPRTVVETSAVTSTRPLPPCLWATRGRGRTCSTTAAARCATSSQGVSATLPLFGTRARHRLQRVPLRPFFSISEDGSVSPSEDIHWNQNLRRVGDWVGGEEWSSPLQCAVRGTDIQVYWLLFLSGPPMGSDARREFLESEWDEGKGEGEGDCLSYITTMYHVFVDQASGRWHLDAALQMRVAAFPPQVTCSEHYLGSNIHDPIFQGWTQTGHRRKRARTLYRLAYTCADSSLSCL